MSELIISVSGVRGTIGIKSEDGLQGGLTPHLACDFGSAFGTMLQRDSGKKRPKVVIGRDTRRTGQMVQHAITSGLARTGVDVIDLAIVTTPGVGIMTKLLQADGGIVITASHNPGQYNGIKFVQANGGCLTSSQAEELNEIRLTGDFFIASADDCGSVSSETRTHGNHIDAVCKYVDTLAVSSRRFKVVLDSINGAGCVVTPMFLGRLGCEVVHINSEPTGIFAHEPEPTEKNLTGLCEQVVKHRAAIGFAQDPDADRLAVVDENGRYIGEEYTLALCAAHILSRRKGNLATNLTTSRMIDDLAERADCKVLRTPTGEANVVEAMLREDCIFGGEGNGGVIDTRIVPIRNSLVGIGYILQHLAETDKPLSELVDEIPRYCMIKTKIACTADIAQKVIEETQKVFKSSEPSAKFNRTDGLRIDIEDAWVIVRPSNTEPIIRIFAEAPTEKSANELIKKITAVAEKSLRKKAN